MDSALEKTNSKVESRSSNFEMVGLGGFLHSAALRSDEDNFTPLRYAQTKTRTIDLTLIRRESVVENKGVTGFYSVPRTSLTSPGSLGKEEWEGLFSGSSPPALCQKR